jgi:hypothetical protein
MLGLGAELEEASGSDTGIGASPSRVRGTSSVNLRQLNDERRIRNSRPTTAPALTILGPREKEKESLKKLAAKKLSRSQTQQLRVASPSHAPSRAHSPDGSLRPTTSPHRHEEPAEFFNNNENFFAKRTAARMGLSERDESALKLGRLVLATILERPESQSTDSLSRFFFDSWLAKSGSSMADADSFSIDLLSKLQKQIAQVQEHALLADADPDAEEKGEETSIAAENEMQSKKSVAAVSLEALDRVISEFGRANPVLTDIRSALLPLLFVDASAEEKEEEGEEKNTGAPRRFDRPGRTAARARG